MSNTSGALHSQSSLLTPNCPLRDSVPVPETTPLTPEQVAAELGWARKTVYRWLNAGWLDGAVQLPNGRWRIPQSTVRALRAGKTTEPAA